jgi:hypothetical protein
MVTMYMLGHEWYCICQGMNGVVCVYVPLSAAAVYGPRRLSCPTETANGFLANGKRQLCTMRTQASSYLSQ